MKRVLLSVIGTVIGVVALLSFKTHGGDLAGQAGGLPSAALPASSPARSSGAGGVATGAPPDPSRTTPSIAHPSSAASTGYVGSAVTTRYGVVQVKIAVSGRTITNVSFVQLTAFDGRSQQINSQAAPTLLQEALAAQSAQIDTVSGASYTSQGYIESLQSALDKAGIQ